MFASFAPFDENEERSELSVNNNFRSYEELVNERCGINEREDYTTLFKKIKEKLFKMNTVMDINFADCPIVKQYRDDFNALKQNVCNVYTTLTNAETELNEAKEKYASFCESIKKCVNFVHNTGTADQNDILLRDILENKIDTYYTHLKIDELIKQYNIANLEFEKTKFKISTISNVVLPPTICQICLERQVDYFIDPCGHTICEQCKIKCEKTTDCHYCRTKKKCYRRLYL